MGRTSAKRSQNVGVRMTTRLYAALENIAIHQQWTLSQTAAILIEERIREKYPWLLERGSGSAPERPDPSEPPGVLNEPKRRHGP